MQQVHQGLVQRVDSCDSWDTMVYETKGDDIPTVGQVERASMRDILGHIRTKSIPISPHLQQRTCPGSPPRTGVCLKQPSSQKNQVRRFLRFLLLAMCLLFEARPTRRML